MNTLTLRAMGAALGLAALASAPAMVMAQEAVSMSDWQIHTGDSKVAHGEGLNKDALGGDLEPWFQYANVPAATDAGWSAAPSGETIAFRAKSTLTDAECKKAVDHTYFQTFVNVPDSVDVTQFDLALKGMDDIARISIYNTANPNGSVVAGSYVRRGQDNLETSDLKDLLAKGENRVVITLLDNCGGGNNLDEAKVELNGQSVPVVQQEQKICSPQTGDMIDIGFVNRTQGQVTFHWMEFDCTEGGGPSVAPGGTEYGRIGVGHIFLVRDAAGNLIGQFAGEPGKDFIVE